MQDFGPTLSMKVQPHIKHSENCISVIISSFMVK